MNRRQTRLGLEDVTKPPDGEVHGFRKSIERQFPVKVVSHHLLYFAYSQIHANYL